MENPEIYLFVCYVLFAKFGFSCSFFCVFVRLWFFRAFPYCLSFLSPPFPSKKIVLFYAFLCKLYFSRHRI